MARRQTLSPPLLPGYTYVRPLGSGGFADVFLFQQNMPRRLVAVKVLLSKVQDDASARALAAEADIMASLSSHPSILTVYEASVSSDGRPYMVMEFCPTSLTSRYRSEKIPVAEVLSIGVKVSSAIEAAHRAGLLHRDIKPSNILVTSFGHPVLSDFGVASAVASGDTETIAMSPPWSAPEVVEHRSTGTVATEVWALAATIYTLLAQRSPFDVTGPGRGNEQQLKNRIAKAKYKPTARADVPRELESVLEGGMRRIPGDRYPSAAVFGQALQWVEQSMGLPVTAMEIATDEWAQASAVAPSDDAPRGPTRSTVPVESQRLRRNPNTSSRAGTGTLRNARANRVGRTVITAAIIGAVVLVGVIAGIVITVSG